MTPISRCPTCAGKRIRRVRRSLKRTSRGRSYTVPPLTFHECPDCGEQVFSPEAMEKIESHRPRRAATHA